MVREKQIMIFFPKLLKSAYKIMLLNIGFENLWLLAFVACCIPSVFVYPIKPYLHHKGGSNFFGKRGSH